MSGVLRTNIELRDPKSLKPYKHNNKRHNSAQIKKLMRAIAEHGFDQPIVVDGSGVIIKGHGRLQAALEMKLKQVPVIVASDLTPEQVRAARLADNAIADDAPLDLDAVKFELGELSDLGVNLDLTGFDDAELDRFLADIPTTEYQAPQMFGGGYQEQEQGTEPPRPFTSSLPGNEEQEPEAEQEAVKPPAGAKYPLSIVLSSGELKEWKAIKETLGEKQDTRAFLKIMEQMK